MITDKFQPMAIIKKLDEMRHSLDTTCQVPDYLTPTQWTDKVDGMKIALTWARVEILAMACDPDRYKE